jgi:hypothetical protein
LDFDPTLGINDTAIAWSLRGIADWLFLDVRNGEAADYLGVAAGRLLAASEVAAHLSVLRDWSWRLNSLFPPRELRRRPDLERSL